MNINTRNKIAKLRSGQTIYHVNPYGTLDPNDLLIQKLRIKHNVRDCGDYTGWSAIIITTQSLVRELGHIREDTKFSDDLIMDGKYTTTSRRNAEAFVKRLQSSGYQNELLIRHNERVLEDFGYFGYFGYESYFDEYEDM